MVLRSKEPHSIPVLQSGPIEILTSISRVPLRAYPDQFPASGKVLGEGTITVCRRVGVTTGSVGVDDALNKPQPSTITRIAAEIRIQICFDPGCNTGLLHAMSIFINHPGQDDFNTFVFVY
jgi:hypothetical protein